MSRATNKHEASRRGSNLAYKALKPLAEARKDRALDISFGISNALILDFSITQ